MSIINPTFDETMSAKQSRVSLEKASVTDRKPLRMKRSLVEFLYSLLVGAVAFMVSYGFGYWLFADHSPETGQIGGLILAPVMGILLFGFAWGYFGQRHKGASH